MRASATRCSPVVPQQCILDGHASHPHYIHIDCIALLLPAGKATTSPGLCNISTLLLITFDAAESKPWLAPAFIIAGTIYSIHMLYLLQSTSSSLQYIIWRNAFIATHSMMQYIHHLVNEHASTATPSYSISCSKYLSNLIAVHVVVITSRISNLSGARSQRCARTRAP